MGRHSHAGRPPARLMSAGSAEDERSRAAAFRQPFFGFAFDAYRGVRAHGGETRTVRERSRVGFRKIFEVLRNVDDDQVPRRRVRKLGPRRTRMESACENRTLLRR